jgi:hypothetical protein
MEHTLHLMVWDVGCVRRQVSTSWCGAGGRRPELAEMGIKRKWEQCGYDRQKFLFSKIVAWVYFYMHPSTVFPGY